MSESTFGEFQFSGDNTGWAEVKFDRLALDAAGYLLFASVLTDSGIVKGIRAALNCDKRITLTAKGVKVRRASDAERTAREPGTIAKADGGYTTMIHRLEYGVAHAFYITRRPGFMLALTDEHLWHELTQPEYTTPILREWVGYIRGRLVYKGLLKEAACYGCECALLTATTADLDLIVTEGLQDGDIAIPSKAA